MQTGHPSSAPNYADQAGNLRSGNRVSRVLLTGREGSLNNFRFSMSGEEGDSNWSTPRHRHNFEQLRHPLEGDYIIGKNEVLPAGWVGYFPESAYYGPQALSTNLRLLVLQYGGPSGNGFASTPQRRKGYDDLLAKGGKFEDGVYTWLDAEGRRHNQDAFEAVWEHMNQRKIEYPVSRYRDLILMNPAGYSWVHDDDTPGVAWKILGTFTERNVRVGFIRLEKGASLQFGKEKAPEIAFIKEGAVSESGTTYGLHSAMSVQSDEAPVTLKAAEPTELYYMKLPTF